MYKRHILSNKVRVVMEHIPYINSISIGVWVKSGSRYENEDNNGVAHFIEHMLFKGTKNRSSRRIAEEIEELGGQINAFTGKEATCFYVKLLDEHYKVGIHVLSDMIRNPLFDEAELEKEKSVIQEEINMYEDSPEDLVADIISSATWKTDTLAFSILGSSGSIRSMNRQKLFQYYSSIYTPENTVVSIAGNFDENEILSELETAFSGWTMEDEKVPFLSSPSISKELVVRSKDIEQLHLSLTLKGIEVGNDKLYTLLAINNFFGGGTSSSLFQKIREEKGYVYTIYSFPSSYKNCGVFNIYFALNEQYLEDALDLIRKEMHSLVDRKMSSTDIKKSKEQLKGSYILGLESTSSRMFSMGKSELMLNKIFEPREVLSKIDEITDQDVNEMIDFIFSEGIYSAACVGRNIDETRLKGAIWG